MGDAAWQQGDSSMNRHTVRATFVATIVATLALASATAVAGKPVPSDACTTATDFPAFAHLIPASGNKPYTIYVADSTGKCSRTLIAGRAPKLSYPVPPSSKTGRVVFFGDSASSIDTVDFTVGAGNTVTVGPTRRLYVNRGCCALDLSKDGNTVYFSDTDSSLATLNVATLSMTQIYALPLNDASWFFQQVSVNGDGTQLYATMTGNQLNSGASKLVRIDLATTPATAIILREWPQQTGYGSHFFSPAANQRDNRVAFNEYIVGTNNCTPLVVTDMDGIPILPAPGATARYGKFGTWVGDNVVMERRGPMDGSGKCASTTSISQIDPTTNAETVLTTGYQPNGR
jgi:hypothetical protein